MEQQLPPSSVSLWSISTRWASSSLTRSQVIFLSLTFSSFLWSSLFLKRYALFQPNTTRSKFINSTLSLTTCPFTYKWAWGWEGLRKTLPSMRWMVACFGWTSLPPKMISLGGFCLSLPTVIKPTWKYSYFFGEEFSFFCWSLHPWKCFRDKEAFFIYFLISFSPATSKLGCSEFHLIS